MKKNTLAVTLLSVSLFAAVLSGCASSRVEQPLWADSLTLESVYPREAYIARIGYGATQGAARAMSEGELSLYFEHSVQTQTQAVSVMREASGNSSAVSRELSRSVLVESSLKLFAVSHTEPWFDKRNGRYVDCAYIERAQAWKFYEPRLISAREAFLQAYNSATGESDYLKRILLLEKARPAAADYEDSLYFSSALYEPGFKKYQDDLELTGSISAEQETLRLKSVMRVFVSGDKDNAIGRKVSSILSQAGYVLSERNALYSVTVSVEPNKSLYGESMTAEPGISVLITNGKENLFVYSRTAPRISGFSAAEAYIDKKIYSALEEELEKSLLESLMAAFE